jgi:hypothetical protein
MEHKAFVFDTQAFKRELEHIIFDAGLKNHPEIIQKYIDKHIGKVYSPYTEDLLEEDWEEELENGGVQELADFALTCYYSVDDDCGLSYLWEALLEALRNISIKVEPEYCVLGHSLKKQDFILDPGAMGMGFVQAKDIFAIYKELIRCRGEFIQNGLPSDEDLLYEDITLEELVEAYDKMIALYKDALDNSHGLLMMF